jgi:methylmalonyl-CoA/ethylmalonyl-CoA epimerase
MIGRLNHVAIVVPDIENAAALYSETFGATVSEPIQLPEHGVIIVFVELENTRIELLHPLGESSPVKNFLLRNPSGSVHHICYEVDDLLAARNQLEERGARVIGGREPKIGAHGKPVLFLHPKDCCGTLIELEEAVSTF